MIHECSKKKIYVIKYGQLDSTRVYQTLILANRLQRAYEFEYLPDIDLPVDEKYRLPNGGYETSEALKDMFEAKVKNLPFPRILMTGLPMGEREYAHEEEYFFFSSREEDVDKSLQTTIMSTQPLKYLPKTRSIQDYLLMMLGSYVLSEYADLGFHDETKGCCLDYCDDPADFEKAFQNTLLCVECEQKIQNKIRQNKITIEEVASAMRLINKAAKRQYCFVIMPFKDDFNPVYKVLKNIFTDAGWIINRADEIAYPRLITNKILREILTADLALADLSKNSPNVFYEVGLAHALGNDVLFLSQGKKIPFDIANEETIFYESDNLEALADKVQKGVFRKYLRSEIVYTH